MNKRHTRVAASRPLLTVLLGCILMNHRGKRSSVVNALNRVSVRAQLTPRATQNRVASRFVRQQTERP